MKNKRLEEVDFLQFIYKNAEMGIVGINNIIVKVKDENLEDVLKNEKQEYENICRESESILKKYGKSNEEIGVMAKVSSKVMSEMSMLKDDSMENDDVLRVIRKIEEMKFEKLNIKFLYDKLWGVWIGDIKKDELYQYLEIVYSQITEAENCFNIKEIFSAE